MARPAHQGRDNRSGIDNVDFARIISQNLFDRIPTFDRLRFQQDLVAGRWLRQPGGTPCTEGAGTGAFLKPDQKLVRKWKSRMRFRANGAAAPLKVGLIWRSALQNARRSRQYLKIEQLAPLLEVKGAVLYSLQYDISEDEAAFCKSNGIRLLDDVDWRNDLETVAAVTSQLDLVIGISSSSYEIAAAVGTECWLLGVSPELSDCGWVTATRISTGSHGIPGSSGQTCQQPGQPRPMRHGPRRTPSPALPNCFSKEVTPGIRN